MLTSGKPILRTLLHGTYFPADKKSLEDGAY